MVRTAVLCIENEIGEWIAIPVTNFPLVPVGTSIQLYIADDVFFESAVVSDYELNNRNGLQINIDLGEELPDVLAGLQNLCVKDKNGDSDYYYPKVIDFGVQYPASS